MTGPASTGMLNATGNPIVTGAGIGLISSLWVCDTSDNGAFIPAGSLGDIDAGCALTQILVGGITGGGSAFVATKLAQGGYTLTQALAISCVYGAVEGGAATAVTSYANPNEDVTLNSTLINAALGCALSGVLGAREARRVIDITSEVTGGISNAGHWADLAPAAFDDLPGQGWSAVWDEAEDIIIARPSIDSYDPPDGWVSQYSGHRAVDVNLTELVGKPSAERVGFVIFNNADGVKITWNSVSINKTRFGDKAAPEEYREAIIEAVEELLDRLVVDFQPS